MVHIRPEIEDIKDEIIDFRRDFHKHPELGFEVHRTAKIVADYLSSLGLDVKTGIGKTGVVGELYGANPGPTIALRADMDALPIQETGDISFKSINDGIMHACGHDGHTAILLGVANVLASMKEKLHGNVRFIFQPAEEGDGGAQFMIDDGCLDQVDEIYGLHLWNYQPYGQIGVQSGPVMAAADGFHIHIKGKGGHGAAPQVTVDAIAISGHVITALQTIVSRNTNPLENTVITIGKINGGYNFNIIADTVTMEGTARSYTEENRQMIKTRMKDILDGLGKSFGASITLDYWDGYPPTVNHEIPTVKVKQAICKITDNEGCRPYLSMGGEDFSYYLQKIPGSFFFLGSSPLDREPMSVPHHCSHFDFDERALLVGSSIFIQIIEDALVK